jgi:WD40 repeat protein
VPRLTLHLDLELVRAAEVARPDGVLAGDWNRYLLRDPGGSGRYEEGELLWDESMQADLSALGDLVTAPGAIERLAASMRSFVDTAGWKGIAGRIGAARAGGRAVAITLRAAAHELYTLPWEFLDMAGSPLYETGDCLLRYAYPGEAAAPQTPQTPASSSRVLVAWAGAVPAAEHVKAITAAARAAHVPFDPARDVLAAASLAGLERALRQAPVTILHLLCHGDALPGGQGFGLRLEGSRAPVAPDQMRALLAPHGKTLRLVVLAACLGASPGAIDNELGSVAQAIHAAGVPAVVASRYPLTLPGSTELTRVLYQRLWVDHASLEDAFLAVRAALRARPRGPAEPHGVDAMAVQLHGGEAPALDFRPWIFRPYRGLSAYQREDASLFFGREDDRQALLDRVADALAHQAPRFLLVAGASGTGKSSLVRAGLVPALEALEALEAGKLGPGPAWTGAFLRPGEGDTPAELLADCLARHRVKEPGGGPGSAFLVLVVDQLEEIFTEVGDDHQREAFLRALWQLACEPAGDVFVVATIRIEYMGRLGSVRMDDSGVPFDRELLAAGRYHLLRQLGPREYERIIRGPAATVGIEIEPGLVDRLLDALRAEPGALPLLSYTLDRLWQERRFQTVDIEHPAAPGERTPVTGWWLTDAAYDALGGIAGALVRSADELVATFDAAHEDELRRVLVQLVHGHDDPMLATRRRGWRDTMRPDPVSEPEAARVYDRVLDALIQARLVVTGSAAPGAPTWIELAHDSLAHVWPRLRAWHSEARAWLAHTGELVAAATAWQPHARAGDTAEAPEARDREEPYLLRGQRLGYQLEAWQRHRHHLGARDRQLVQAFLDACQRAEAERRAREIEAERQGARAEERALAARDAAIMSAARKLLTAGQPAWATKLLGEVARPLETRDWLSLAWDQLSSTPLASTLRGHEREVRTAAFSPDGTLVLTSSPDGTARIWRADGRGDPVVLRGHEGEVNSAVFSPDGALVLTASDDCTARVWPVDGAGPPRVFEGHDDVIYEAAFSPDGRRFVTASQDHTARVWRLDRPRQSKALRGHEDSVFAAAFGADATHVSTVSADRTARIWRVDSRARPAVLRHPDPHDIGVRIVSAKLSRDGKYVVTHAWRDATVRIWPLTDPEHPIVLAEHEEPIESIDVSPDSKLVVTAAGRTARLWNIAQPERPEFEYHHPGNVMLAAFSPDGKLVVTVSADATSPGPRRLPQKTARVWQVDLLRRSALPRVLSGHEDRIAAAGFSPDGRYLVTASDDRTARIWRVDEDLVPVEALPRQPGERIFSASFGPRGLLVAATTNPDPASWQVRATTSGPGMFRPVIRVDRTLRFWCARGSDPCSVLARHDAQVLAAAFSPDGKLVATGYDDHTARIWSLEGVEPGPCTVLAGHEASISSVSFSDDGRLVVTTSRDGTARVWPLENPAGVTVLAGHEHAVVAAAFSPDGRLVATGSDDRTVRVWRLQEPHDVTVLRNHTNPLVTVQVSQDAKHLLTQCSDGTARVWRLDSGAEPPLVMHEQDIRAAAFSPDGERVVTASRDGTARIRRIDDPDRLTALEGHERSITTAVFSPDGKLVVTASDDNTARVWLVADPDQFMVLRHGTSVASAQFSADSAQVLTTCLDSKARLWTIDVETLRARLRSATSDCLPPDMRQRYLGETAAEARQRHEECERSHGRTPSSGQQT